MDYVTLLRLAVILIIGGAVCLTLWIRKIVKHCERTKKELGLMHRKCMEQEAELESIALEGLGCTGLPAAYQDRIIGYVKAQKTVFKLDRDKRNAKKQYTQRRSQEILNEEAEEEISDGLY